MIAAWATARLMAGESQVVTRSGRTASEIPGVDGLVEMTTLEFKRARNPSQIAAFDDVRDVMAHASEWRWYSRDRGILLAIPVREGLGIEAKVEGERALADVVRRLINQAGWGNPPVQVVLVEGEVPCCECPRCPPCVPSPPIVPCACY
jgi:hypothetical protein